MSRLARNPITIPEDIKVSLNNNIINFEGKLGKSSASVPEGISIDLKDNLLHFAGDNKALLGTRWPPKELNATLCMREMIKRAITTAQDFKAIIFFSLLSKKDQS